MKTLCCFIQATLGIILLSSFQSCDPDDNPETVVDFNPVIPISIYPFKDTFNLGDTIWVEADFPDSVQDFYSGKWAKLEDNFDFATDFVLMNLLYPQKTFSDQKGNANTYKFYPIIGEGGVASETFATLSFIYDPDIKRYKFKMALIPSVKGVNAIGFLYYGSNYEAFRTDIKLGLDSMGRPIMSSVRFIHYNINNGHTNFAMLDQNTFFEPNTKEDSILNRQGIFTYYLK